MTSPVFDRIETLECALADISKESRDREIRIEELLDENAHQEKLLKDFRIAVNSDDKPQTIRLLQSKIEGFESALAMLNARLMASPNYEASDQLSAAKTVIEKLQTQIRDHNHLVSVMETEIDSLRIDVINTAVAPKLMEKIEECDRVIEILKDNLTRARSEHLAQLEALKQMLQPLATHEDEGSLYLTHFGKAAMVTLIQQVIAANIKRLDPCSCYDENF